ncbi:MAG: MutS-related protein [Thermoguttaceae bacterium]
MDFDNTIEELYRRRMEKFSMAETRWARRERRVMNLRVATFLLAVVMFFLGWKNEPEWFWYAAGGAMLICFSGLVVYHERVRRAKQRAGLFRWINEQSIARLHRDWQALSNTAVHVPAKYKPITDDLDLFGHASLFHWLCTAVTSIGVRTLRDWILHPAGADEIKRRQQAVLELAPLIELRQTLIANGLLLTDDGRATDSFTRWAEDTPWLTRRPWLLWLSRAMAGLALSTLLLIFCHILPIDLGALVLMALILVNVGITTVFGGKVHNIFSITNLQRNEALQYLSMFKLICSMKSTSAELDAIKREASDGGGVLQRLGQLNRIAKLAMLSQSPLLFFLVYLPLQFAFLYDFHILNLLERWQIRYGCFARVWFRALGKFEALSSLANLANDHPDWAVPEVDLSAASFSAVKLGHPLLPDDICVHNAVEIGPAGTCLLVTGSNMSGKSTLLRAAGVNAVLAQAGAPVCAERMAMPPVTLATSMRLRDSLEQGVSFYMAELTRLKAIVDLARDVKGQNDRLLLYLLDEILLGTNSRERHIAVVRVLQHLVHCKAIGAISTHDLDLAASEPISDVCRCVHFRETLHDRSAEQPMTFDYMLRPGMATTTNALKLLEIVGLEDSDAKQQMNKSTH